MPPPILTNLQTWEFDTIQEANAFFLGICEGAFLLVQPGSDKYRILKPQGDGPFVVGFEWLPS